ncbi:MAG: hypothetical protein U0800_22980 [Isosphaeraceae bacterium]
MPLLSREQYLSTFDSPMRRAGVEGPPFDFWPYFNAIPPADYEGHDCSGCEVESVYRDPSGRYEHVLVKSQDRNVFMALVLDLSSERVYGHWLLDLNREYGLGEGSE